MQNLNLIKKMIPHSKINLIFHDHVELNNNNS